MLPKVDGSRRKLVESLTPWEREQLELAYRYYAKIAASRGREANLFPQKRTGERGLERFRENPRLDMLDRILRQSTELTPAKEKQMAERLQRQSLN